MHAQNYSTEGRASIFFNKIWTKLISWPRDSSNLSGHLMSTLSLCWPTFKISFPSSSSPRPHALRIKAIRHSLDTGKFGKCREARESPWHIQEAWICHGWPSQGSSWESWAILLNQRHPLLNFLLCGGGERHESNWTSAKEISTARGMLGRTLYSTNVKLAANPVAELGERIDCPTRVRVQGLCGGSFTLLQFCTTLSRCSFALQCKCVRTSALQFLA